MKQSRFDNLYYNTKACILRVLFVRIPGPHRAGSLFVIQFLRLILGLTSQVDAQFLQHVLIHRGQDHAGMSLTAPEFLQLLQKEAE